MSLVQKLFICGGVFFLSTNAWADQYTWSHKAFDIESTSSSTSSNDCEKKFGGEYEFKQEKGSLFNPITLSNGDSMRRIETHVTMKQNLTFVDGLTEYKGQRDGKVFQEQIFYFSVSKNDGKTFEGVFSSPSCKGKFIQKINK